MGHCRSFDRPQPSYRLLEVPCDAALYRWHFSLDPFVNCTNLFLLILHFPHASIASIAPWPHCPMPTTLLQYSSPANKLMAFFPVDLFFFPLLHYSVLLSAEKKTNLVESWLESATPGPVPSSPPSIIAQDLAFSGSWLWGWMG